MLNLYREIFYQTEVERLKRELTCRFDWSVQGAFETLDFYNEGRISVESLKTFLKVNGFQSTGREVDAIMRRLDSDSDFALSLPEFYDIFSLRRQVDREAEFREEKSRRESSYMMICSRREEPSRRYVSPERSSPLRKGDHATIRSSVKPHDQELRLSPLRVSVEKK